MATRNAGGNPQFGAIRKFADGGRVAPPTSFRGLFNAAKGAISNAMAPETPEQGAARRAADYESMKAKYGAIKAPAPTAEPAQATGISQGLDGSGGSSVDRRMKEAGAYANGGVVKKMGAMRAQTTHQENDGDEVAPVSMDDQDGDEPPVQKRAGAKIKGPGTATSDSIDAEVVETGEPIRVANGERIVSAAQEQYLQKLAQTMGFDSVDAMLEQGTGKPVGPTVKQVPENESHQSEEEVPMFACGGKVKGYSAGGAIKRGFANGAYFDPNAEPEKNTPAVAQQPTQQPTSYDDKFMPATRAVVGGVVDDVSRNIREGNYGAAIGNAAKSIAVGPAIVEDSWRPWGTVAKGVGNAVSTAFGGSETAFGGSDGTHAPTATTAPTAKPAGALPQASYSNEGRNYPTPESAGALRKTGPDTTDLGGGITKIEEKGKSPLFTNLSVDDPSNVNLINRQPMTAQNQTALDNLTARQNSENKALALGAIQKPSGPSMMVVGDGGGYGLLSNEEIAVQNATSSIQDQSEKAKIEANVRGAFRDKERMASDMQRAQLTSDTQKDINTQNLAADRYRTDSQSQIALAKGAIDRSKLAIEQAAEGRNAGTYAQQMAQRAKMDALQTAYEKETDKGKRAVLLENIRALSPNAGHAKDNFLVVGGGQEWDDTAKMMRTNPQRLIDVRTGQEVGEHQKPQQQFEVGKVYNDANGNRAKWDGKNFVPV